MNRPGGGFDRFISVFSPEGRLFQVDYAYRAGGNDNQTTIGIKCPEGVVIGTLKVITDNLLDPDSMTNIFLLNDKVACVMAGRFGDSRSMVYRAQLEASQYKLDRAVEMPVDLLAKRMGDLEQMRSQYVFVRPRGCFMTLMSDTALYRIDPGGYHCSYQAVAAGSKEIEGNAFLEKKIKRHPVNSMDHALTIAVDTLQFIALRTLTKTELELATMTRTDSGSLFHKLTEQEIQLRLDS